MIPFIFPSAYPAYPIAEAIQDAVSVWSWVPCISCFIAVKQRLVTQTFSDITDDPIEQINNITQGVFWDPCNTPGVQPRQSGQFFIYTCKHRICRLRSLSTRSSHIRKKNGLNQNFQDQGKQSLTKQHCSAGLPNMNHWTITRIPLSYSGRAHCWSFYRRKRQAAMLNDALIRCVMPFVAPLVR